MGRNREYILKAILFSFIFLNGVYWCFGSGPHSAFSGSFNKESHITHLQPTDSIERMSAKLYYLMSKEKFKEALPYALKTEKLIKSDNIPVEKTIYPAYLVSVCYAKNNRVEKAIDGFNNILETLKQHPIDSIYSKVYYNLGALYNWTGDNIRSLSNFIKSFEYDRKIYPKNDPSLAFGYFAQATTSISLRENSKSLELVDLGLEIVRQNPGKVSDETIVYLFQTKGTALSRNFDYHQAIKNFEKALSYYDIPENRLKLPTSLYINMISNIITAYYYLGKLDQCSYYFKKGEEVALSGYSSDIFDLYLNYASILAENGKKQKGLELLSRALEIVKKENPAASRTFNNSRVKYANFLLEYSIDPSKAMEIFFSSFRYLKSHPWDISLGTEISLGYALSLAENGKIETGLDSVRSILFREAGLPVPADFFSNPPDSLLKADKVSYDILDVKYKILGKLYAEEKVRSVLESAVSTSELMISVLEKIRISIGEEESRLMLGNRYRDAYLNVIRSISDCYTITHEQQYLEKAFEYSEKSKAASLLASMREMKAINDKIPPELAEMERRVIQRIGLYTALSEEERAKDIPDAAKLNKWTDSILAARNTRDSLKKEFEKNYPDYYSLKFNTHVIGTADIRKLIGNEGNYLSYVVSDTVLYIMVVNSKYTHIETIKIDSTFNETVSGFKQLISFPDRSGAAKSKFEKFQDYGYKLYSLLIAPVRNYLISNELIISPDNTLASFPYETLVTTDEKKSDLQYRLLPYLMNEFRISYAYSATLLAETPETKRTIRNRLVAFAPSYSKPVDINSIWANRQEINGTLPELKYASEEAAFVSKLTWGKLFADSSATKSRFSNIAGKFNIIHMAMHTVINSNEPSNSGMIFTDSDTLIDNTLRPYEIYNILLNAKMVVLSSCYTGDGKLFEGEGVLSLARGFIFAGSHSVVMSLWEVNDYSGTEIIKSFYRNLKRGKAKSESLREARIDYLRNADMLHAHPYFWSTMVIYGDDAPVYVSDITRILFVLIPLLMIFLVYSYFRKR